MLITPAGGFISPGWALLLGAAGALIPYAIIAFRPRTRVDETLDVLAAHGMAGFIGILFIGFFAQKSWNDRLLRRPHGLFYGNADQLLDQVLAAVVAPAYAFVDDVPAAEAHRAGHAAAGRPRTPRPWAWT